MRDKYLSPLNETDAIDNWNHTKMKNIGENYAYESEDWIEFKFVY